MGVRVKLLGTFEIEGLDPRRLGSRKARTLLKLLAVARGQPVAVDRVIECVWPDDLAPSRPDEQVAVLVSRLRTVIGSDSLVKTSAGYQLVVDWLDIDAVADLTDQAARQLAAGNCALARVMAEAALERIRGPVLADEHEASWVAGERAPMERIIAGLRHTAARAALSGADFDTAARYASLALDADPYDELASRLAIRAHDGAGRPASALAVYAAFRERIVEELGADPASETEELHLAVLRQERLPEDRVSPVAMLHPPRLNPAISDSLPGREGELAQLDAALDRAAQGSVELVLVEGEAGIGKSRLLDAWQTRARAAGCTVLQARGHELERTLPLQPVLDALDEHLRTLGSADAILDVLGREHSMLAPLLKASPAWSGILPIDPVEGEPALFAALFVVFARISEHAPVALLVDDLHFADRATLAWLHFVARKGAGERLLIVGALRPEEISVSLVARRVSLKPLSLAAVEQIVGTARASELHVRSGGHPLFLVELAATNDASLPTSLKESAAARCDRAGPEVAGLLRTAAVLGTSVDVELLAVLTNATPLEVLSHIEEGVRRRLLDERDNTMVFHHDLVREALVATLSEARIALIHREAARRLAARPNPDALDVAYHARLGGDANLAASAFAEAAIRAGERFDHAESERLLDLSIELADCAAYRLQRARTRIFRGGYREAEADAIVAIEYGAGAAALELAGWAAYYARDFPAARRYGEDGARVATGSERGRCLALAGRARHLYDDPVAAEGFLREAVATVAEPGQRLASEVWLAQLRVHQGYPEEALELARPARYLPSPPAAQPIAVYACMATVHALGTLGRAAEALIALDDWEAEMERQRVTRFRHRPLNYRGWILRGLGDLAGADEMNLAALEEARRLETAEPAAQALLDLAEGRLRAGDPDAAIGYLDAVPPLYSQNPAAGWRLELRERLLRGRAALATGDAEDALALAEQLRRDAASFGTRRYEDFAFLLGIRAAVSLRKKMDLSAVGPVLLRLPEHAGLEAWWVTAEVAAATGSEAVWSIAETQAGQLAGNAGHLGDAFRRYARARFASLGH